MRGTYSPWSLIPARSSHCANLVSQGTVPSGTSASANRPRRHYRSSRSDTIIFHFPFSTFHYFDLRTAIQYLIPGPWTLFPETQITGYIPGIRDSGGLSCYLRFRIPHCIESSQSRYLRRRYRADQPFGTSEASLAFQKGQTIGSPPRNFIVTSRSSQFQTTD